MKQKNKRIVQSNSNNILMNLKVSADVKGLLEWGLSPIDSIYISA